MSNTLKDRIADDTRSAMKARDRERLGALRLIGAAIKQREVDERITLDDAAVVAVLEKMLKQRRDSVSQYQAAGRDDLAAKETFEMEVIGRYMPEALDEAAIEAQVDAAIAEAGASSVKDMGKVMGLLKGRLQGRADMAAVSGKVRERLNAGG